ncbi:MAG: GtrA family protein, partial [Candidatus Gottesmanbacteria bacterium]|nr:GtrA family protein [Candidatus Gottesmanbacteria bacterium]
GGSIPENWGLIRKIYSVMGNSIVRFGLWHPRIHDWTGGYRAYTKKYYLDNREKVKGYSGYVFQIAFLHSAIHDNAHTFEVPIHFTDRRFGHSKIAPADFTDRRFGHSKIAPAEYILNIIRFIIVTKFQEIVAGSFGKFLVVGGIGFFINTIVYAILIRTTKLDPIIANTIGAELAIISNYFWNNLWTFKDRRYHDTGTFILKLIQFNLTSVVGVMLIQNGTIFLGTRVFGQTFNSRMSFYFLGTALLLIWNYFIYSKVIWKKK